MNSPARNRRADARRSRAAILDAAIEVLGTDPDAGLGTIAKAAGVTRQTVYAHFDTREHLLWAAADRITEETVAAMDAAEPDTGPAADALIRTLDAADEANRRYPALVRLISALPAAPETDRDRHGSVADRITRVIERGQQAGEFDTRLDTGWAAAATIGLAHLAAEEEIAGRLDAATARRTLHMSLLKLLAAPPEGR